MANGMNDVAMKPKLLRSLLREYVPHEKHPFSNPSELSYVVSTVKTHNLLSESVPHSVEQDFVDEKKAQDLVEEWKAAVDSWINRLLALVSSNLPDKCWAGICLLGVTSQDCSTERFLASYADWLNKLLPFIQAPLVSHFVMAASCAALSDMLTRLSNAKRDLTSQATRIIQPALKLLSEDVSDVVLEAAICLLCTLTTLFPKQVHQHYNSIEATIVTKLMSGNCSDTVLKKLGYILSLLPRSRGDEDSWSLMMEKILLSINNQLNDAFQGLEEDSEAEKTMRALLPSGKQPPPPLGGLEQSSDFSSRRPEKLLGSRISTLMHCCCNMLTTSYPVLVPVPIHGLVALTSRVLMVDGSSSPMNSSMTTLKQEFICSELPLLHIQSLEILMALIKGLSSQVLPHIAAIVRLLEKYLRRCIFPDLRIKAYSIMKILFISMGVGTAIHLNQVVIQNILVDLKTYSKVNTELLSGSSQRKRKHSGVLEPVQEHPASDVHEAERNLIPISVKIAALEALETLLTVGGSMRSESWRANVDRLLIDMATDACKEGWSREENNVFLSGKPTSVWANFQLAALRALLASLLSPGRQRPIHLGLALELFRRGTQCPGTKLAEFCIHALLSLEVLIHPRARSLWDLELDEHRPRKEFHSVGEPESVEDELEEKWHGNVIEPEILVFDGQQNVNTTENPSIDPSSEQLPFDQGNSSTHVPEVPLNQGNSSIHISEVRASSYITNTGVSDGDELMVESHSVDQPGTSALDIITVRSAVASEANDDGFAGTLERMPGNMLYKERDDDESSDGFPDIVDGDPDSD